VTKQINPYRLVPGFSPSRSHSVEVLLAAQIDGPLAAHVEDSYLEDS
jgi:hypothetical protein